MDKITKMIKDLAEDKEYLKHCLELQSQRIPIPRFISFGLGSKQVVLSPKWWHSDDTVLTVARLLERWGQFKERSDVIDFFEKPYKFEQEMKFIVEEM